MNNIYITGWQYWKRLKSARKIQLSTQSDVHLMRHVRMSPMTITNNIHRVTSTSSSKSESHGVAYTLNDSVVSGLVMKSHLIVTVGVHRKFITFITDLDM